MNVPEALARLILQKRREDGKMSIIHTHLHQIFLTTLFQLGFVSFFTGNQPDKKPASLAHL
jgi:hypothetical protein